MTKPGQLKDFAEEGLQKTLIFQPGNIHSEEELASAIAYASAKRGKTYGLQRTHRSNFKIWDCNG